MVRKELAGAAQKEADVALMKMKMAERRAVIASLEKDEDSIPVTRCPDEVECRSIFSTVSSLSLPSSRMQSANLERAYRGGERSTLAPDVYDSVTVSSSNSLAPGAIRVNFLEGGVSHRQVNRSSYHQDQRRPVAGIARDASLPQEVEIGSLERRNTFTRSFRYGSEGQLVSAVLVNDDATNNTSAAVALAPPPAARATPIPEDYVLIRKAVFDGTKRKHCGLILIGIGIISAVLAAVIIPLVILAPNKQEASPQGDDTGDLEYEESNVGKTFTTRAERYWDCSGGACGCASLPTGDPGAPLHCHSNAMFRAPAENQWGAKFYGTAAVSANLGGDLWLGKACGKCWRVTGTDNVHQFSSSAKTTIVVKATNFCDSKKCGPGNSFKIAAPGFESDPETMHSICEERENTENVKAFAACQGWMTGNSTIPSDNCNCDMFTVPTLREGCKNFLSLGWDDPIVEYEELAECPPELGRLPCWEENGNNYPEGLPGLCESPFNFEEDQSLEGDEPSLVGDEAEDGLNEESNIGKTFTTRAKRSWDCSGGACGCASLPTGDPDAPLHCHSNAMFRAPAENQWGAKFYGTAAVSANLGGDWWLGKACGKCWRVTGTDNVHHFSSEKSTIVVKATNFCSSCGPETSFHIAAPGFASDPDIMPSVCEERENTENIEAFATCRGWMTGNSTIPSDNCNCDMFTVPTLREGCKNFLSLGWDDPIVEYEELAECPPELGRLPCWEENGNNYPEGLPGLCESPFNFEEDQSLEGDEPSLVGDEAEDSLNEESNIGKTFTTRAKRSWDCSGGACGCASLPTGDPDAPLHCHSNAMFRAPAENQWGAKFYGTAAVSANLGGDWWLGKACGKCWRVTGTDNVHHFSSEKSTIVVKATNFCSSCGPETSFHIAAPGFASDPDIMPSVCEERENTENIEAFATCRGWMTGNSTIPSDNCNCDMFTVPTLREGCKNFLSLGWDDPIVEYEELAECPPELGRLPCWEENGNNYPEGLPGLCESPFNFEEEHSLSANQSQNETRLHNIFNDSRRGI